MSNQEKRDAMRIKVVGIGGGGSNMIDHMMEDPVAGIEYISINTDSQALGKSKAGVRLQIGAEITKGHGAGADMETGRMAAELNRKRIADALSNCDVLFIVAGLGRGTGTGAAPVVADIAREKGIMSVAVVTTPFDFEGEDQKIRAKKGVELLQKSADVLSVIPNDSFTKYIESANITLCNAFTLTDAFMVQIVKNMAHFVQQTTIKQVPTKEHKHSLLKRVFARNFD